MNYYFKLCFFLLLAAFSLASCVARGPSFHVQRGQTAAEESEQAANDAASAAEEQKAKVKEIEFQLTQAAKTLASTEERLKECETKVKKHRVRIPPRGKVNPAEKIPQK